MGPYRACIGKPIVQCNYITNLCTPQYVRPQNQLPVAISSTTTTHPLSTMVQTRIIKISAQYLEASTSGATPRSRVYSSKGVALEASSADFKSIKGKTTTTFTEPVSTDFTSTTDHASLVSAVSEPEGTTDQTTHGTGNAKGEGTTGSTSTQRKLTSNDSEADPASITTQVTPTDSTAIAQNIKSGPTDLASSTSAVSEPNSITGQQVPGSVNKSKPVDKVTTSYGGLNKIEKKYTSKAANLGSTTHKIASSDLTTTNLNKRTRHSARASYYGTTVSTEDPTISPSKRMLTSVKSNEKASQTIKASALYTTSSRPSTSPSEDANSSGSPGTRPRVSTVPELQTNGNHYGQSTKRANTTGRCRMTTIQVCENQPSQTPTPAKKNFWANAEKEIQSLRSPPIVCKTMDFSWKDWTKTDCITSHIAIGLIASLILIIILSLIVLSDIFKVCAN